MNSCRVILCVFLIILIPAISQEKDKITPKEEPVDILAGHSGHGEAFNEGPRQKAYLMKGMPKVNFPVSTKEPLCQTFFNQGLGQLYGFWNLEAERSFRQAALIDPGCAMTYWGMARSNLGNESRSKGFIEEAVKRKGSVTSCEAKHIDALSKYINTSKDKKRERSEAYARELENILLEFPDDTETRALFALQHWTNSRNGVKIQSHLAVDALLQQVFRIDPMHAAHHFRIHLWDHKKASKALDSADVCGQTGPGIAHLWHMSGHIYSKEKLYHNAVYQQEASARVDHAYMMRDRIMPDQIHNFAHNNEWLCRNLVHVGRVGDSVDLARNMATLPRHPKYNTLAKKSGSAYHGRKRLLSAIEQFELWDLLVQLCDSGEIETTKDIAEQRKLLHLLGIAYFRTGNIDAAKNVIAELEGRAKSSVKSPPESNVVSDSAKKPDIEDGVGQSDKVDAKTKAATVKKAVAERKKKQEAEKRRISDVENKLAELHLLKLIHEGKLGVAKEQLGKAKSMDRTRKALAHIQLGQKAEALKIAESMVPKEASTVLPLARAIHLFEICDKKRDAEKNFKKLRKLSSSIDLGSPVFVRLAPIAKRLKFPVDWRIQSNPVAKVANRPALDSLGPFRWKPMPALDWSFTDTNGKKLSLADYKGRPVIIIFYLGFDCLHCVEQLDAFAPKAEAFRKAGIDLVAISTESQNGLREALKVYRDGGDNIPFPIIADESLEVFKAYRVYDGFEQTPLHGTFLVDAEGNVRWQDISHDPFTDVDFLIEESRRLLENMPKVSTISANVR
ncbi:MAG: peroxiredoxin family protein [Opitutae bacterium]|nr:peroxiredoxin family protein [Opitutae bacterium]